RSFRQPDPFARPRYLRFDRISSLHVATWTAPPGAIRSDQMKLWCSIILAADRCGLSETVCPSAATQVSKPLAVQDRTVESTQKSVAHPVIITRLNFLARSNASRRVPRKLSLAVLLIVSSLAHRSSAAKTCQPSVPSSSPSPGGPSCCTQTTVPPPSRTHRASSFSRLRRPERS